MPYFIQELIGAAIGALLGALLIQFATNLLAKFKPPYGMAYKAALLGYLAEFAVGFVIGSLGGLGNSVLPIMVIGFFVGAGVYSMVIKSPQGEKISYGLACMISLIQLILGGAIIFVIEFLYRALS